MANKVFAVPYGGVRIIFRILEAPVGRPGKTMGRPIRPVAVTVLTVFCFRYSRLKGFTERCALRSSGGRLVACAGAAVSPLREGGGAGSFFRMTGDRSIRDGVPVFCSRRYFPTCARSFIPLHASGGFWYSLSAGEILRQEGLRRGPPLRGFVLCGYGGEGR